MKLLLFLIFFGCHSPREPVAMVPLVSLSTVGAPFCDGYVSKANCDDGDSVIFSGLLCLSGIEDGCRTVRDSQGVDGRFWRSPRRAPGNLGSGNSFSRDQALGVLAYLVQSRDVSSAVRWLGWVEDNRPCIIKFLDECRYYGLHRYCKDDDDARCTVTPSMFQLMYYVWTYLGLEPSEQMKIFSGVPILLPAEKGYQIHLYAVSEFIRQRLGRGERFAVEKILEKEPLNPFYMYLDQGKSPEVIARYSELCPEGDHPKTQWAWERLTSTKAHLKSMVWDCLFMHAL
jgi:hypothetical protein